VLATSQEHPDEPSARTRFVDEIPVSWQPAPQGPFEDPVSVREAAATWRRRLADTTAPDPVRLAALEGLVALGVHPQTWWFRRDWTETGRPLHERIKVSYSKLSNLANCELQHVLSDELGLGRPAGYQAWVGKTVHKIIEDCENGLVAKTREAILATLNERWREQEFPSRAVSAAYRKLVQQRMLPNWFDNYANGQSLAAEQYFEFAYDGATINGVIDRIGPILSGGTRITDFKTGNPDNAGKAEESLQLGIYYLAVLECEDLEPFRPVRAVELAYLKGHWKTGDLVNKAWQVSTRSEEEYQTNVRTTLSTLIEEKKRLNDDEVFLPSPEANCHWCDFKTLCPLYPEGATPLQPRSLLARTVEGVA
jgi:RecB family exonuclease